VKDLGVEVGGLGFTVSDCGFQNLRFGGLGFRVSSFGFRVSGGKGSPDGVRRDQNDDRELHRLFGLRFES